MVIRHPFLEVGRAEDGTAPGVVNRLQVGSIEVVAVGLKQDRGAWRQSVACIQPSQQVVPIGQRLVVAVEPDGSPPAHRTKL